MKLGISFLVAAVAGAINSMAGGGTLITFPSLIALGLDDKIANATSTLGLWPASLSGAWGYREEITRGDRDLMLFLLPSVAGGLVGGLLLLITRAEVFKGLVPWLILLATILFALQPLVSKWLVHEPGGPGRRRWGVILPLQFGVAVYGGYFGAGIGILMLAALGFLGIDDIHHRNGIKNLAGAFINGVALVPFIVGGLVEWPVAIAMALGATIGGYLSTHLARRIGPARVRLVVIAVGLSATFWTAYRLTH